MPKLVKGNEKPGWGKRARCLIINLPDEWEKSKCWKLFGESIPKTIDTKAKNYSAGDEEVGIIPGVDGIPEKNIYEIHPILVDVLDILYKNQITGIDLISIINDEIMNGNFSVEKFSAFIRKNVYINDLESRFMESYYGERNEIEKATADTFPFIKSENIEQNGRSIPRRFLGQCLRTQLVKKITYQIIEQYKNRLKKQLQDYYATKHPNDIEKQNNEYLDKRIETQTKIIYNTPGRIERFEGAGITTKDINHTYDGRGTEITFKKEERKKIIPFGVKFEEENGVVIGFSCLYGVRKNIKYVDRDDKEKERHKTTQEKDGLSIPQSFLICNENSVLAQNIVGDSRIIGRTSNIGKYREYSKSITKWIFKSW